MLIFSKDTREQLDRLLQSMTLSKEERYIVIAQLEALVARDIAKIVITQGTTGLTK